MTFPDVKRLCEQDLDLEQTKWTFTAKVVVDSHALVNYQYGPYAESKK